jgi:protein-ribulosamine 3-kinase
MALGEYESQKALAQHLPENAVVPIAYGTFELDPTKSFFITTYCELKKKTPDPTQLVKVLAKLHKGPRPRHASSASTSPPSTGMFR